MGGFVVSYAGITRIRCMGMISARHVKAPRYRNLGANVKSSVYISKKRGVAFEENTYLCPLDFY